MSFECFCDYKELDAGMLNSFDISRLWDSSANNFKEPKNFKFSRTKDGLLQFKYKNKKFLCKDPRIGCIMMLQYDLNNSVSMTKNKPTTTNDTCIEKMDSYIDEEEDDFSRHRINISKSVMGIRFQKRYETGFTELFETTSVDHSQNAHVHTFKRLAKS